MSAFFKDIFQQSFKAQRRVFIYFIEIFYCHITVLFNDKLLYYNAAVYILVESEEYSLIWKVKQRLTDPDKW